MAIEEQFPAEPLTSASESGEELVAPGKKVRTLGLDRGWFEVPEDFDDPLPDEILRCFEG